MLTTFTMSIIMSAQVYLFGIGEFGNRSVLCSPTISTDRIDRRMWYLCMPASLEGFRLLFFPICKYNHWILCVLGQVYDNVTEQYDKWVVYVYDSLVAEKERFYTVLLELCELINDRYFDSNSAVPVAFSYISCDQQYGTIECGIVII